MGGGGGGGGGVEREEVERGLREQGHEEMNREVSGRYSTVNSL